MAGDGVTLKVRRKDELFAKLSRLAPEAETELTKVNAEAAAEMVRLARGFVRKRTGKLAGTIRMEPARSGGYRVTAGGSATTREVRAGSGEPYDYAIGEEFGTAPHRVGGMFAGAHHPGTKARPFFYPAYRLIRKKQRGRATRAINKSVKRVAGK